MATARAPRRKKAAPAGMKLKPDDRTMSKAEVCEMLFMGPSTLDRLTKAGKGPPRYYAPGSTRPVFIEREVREWMAATYLRGNGTET